MKKSLNALFLMAGLFATGIFADHTPTETVIGKLTGTISGNVRVLNPEIAGEFTGVKFVNTGSRAIVITHIRVNEPDHTIHLGPEKYRLAPGAEALHVFANEPTLVDSVEWFVRGSTESMVVYGVKP